MVEIKNLNFDFSDGILRDHNHDVYRKVMYSLYKGQKTLFEQATGTGKSYVACKLLKDFGDNQRALFVCPNKAIQSQFEGYYQKWVVGQGTTNCHFDTCLYQGLNGVKSNQYDIIIFDEVHRMGAKVWGQNSQELMNNNPNALIVGMTATLERPDGVDVKQYFDGNKPVSTLTLPKVLEKGILPCPDYVLAKVDFEDDKKYVESSLKDFKHRLKEAETQEEKIEIQEYIDRLKQAQRDIPHSKEIPEIFAREFTDEIKNGKFIVFCPQGTDNDDDLTEDISRMNQIMKQSKSWFSKTEGIGKIKRYSVYSGRDSKINEHVIKAFEEDDSKALKLLFCVNMLNEGLHVDGIDGVIMLRPTSSNIIYLQQLGRALAVGGNNPKVFDFVANLNSVDIENVQKLVGEVNKGKGNSDGNGGHKDKDEDDEDYKYRDTRFKLTTYNYDEIQFIEELRENLYNFDNVSWEDKVKEYGKFIENGGIPSRSKTASKEEIKWGQMEGYIKKQIRACGGIEEYEKRFPERAELLTKIGFNLTGLTAEELANNITWEERANRYRILIANGGIPSRTKTASDEERDAGEFEHFVKGEIVRCGGIEYYKKKFPERIELLTNIGFDLTGLTAEKLSQKKDPFEERLNKYSKLKAGGGAPSRAKTASDEERDAGEFEHLVKQEIVRYGGIENYEEKFPGRTEMLIKVGFNLTGLTVEALAEKRDPWENKANEYGRFKANGGIPSNSENASDEAKKWAKWAGALRSKIKECGGIEEYEKNFPERIELLTKIGFNLTGLTAEELSQKQDPFINKVKEHGEFIKNGGNPNWSKTASKEEQENAVWVSSLKSDIKKYGGIEKYEEHFPGRKEILERAGFDLTGLTAVELSQKKDPFEEKADEYSKFIKNGGIPSQAKTAGPEEKFWAQWKTRALIQIKGCGGIEEYEKKFPGRIEILEGVGFDLTGLTAGELNRGVDSKEIETQKVEVIDNPNESNGNDEAFHILPEQKEDSTSEIKDEKGQQDKLTAEEIIAKLNKTAPKDTDEGAPPPVG